MDWTKLMRLKYGTSTGIESREQIWQEIFGRPQSTRYWDNVYANIARLKFDTKAMYFHHRLIRHQLETNSIRSTYDRNQRPHCSLCEDASEMEEHQLWECRITRDLINEVSTHMQYRNHIYTQEWGRKTFLFSNVEGNIMKPCNILSLYLKKFIWRVRCEKKISTAVSFLHSFKETIKCIRYAYISDICLGQLPEIVI